MQFRKHGVIIMKLASESNAKTKLNDAWLSLVERCVRDAEAAGSNPVASIKKGVPLGAPFLIDANGLNQRPLEDRTHAFEDAR